MVGGSDIRNEGLRGTSVGKRERLKGEMEKGGAAGEGDEEREFAVCIRASLVDTATNRHQRERVIRNKRRDGESREVF